MEFEFSERSRALRARLEAFMAEHVHPNEQTFWTELGTAADRWAPLPLIERLKDKARQQGLWNLFLPSSEHGRDLSNLDYAPLAEVMGRVHWAPVVFNCSAPDTGNMEVLARFGTPEQKREWLEPLLEGKIRSAFSMTEPAVASSDATNIRTEIRRDGDHYVINGRKWFTSGASFRDCAIFILMGKTDPGNPDRHCQQSMILVPRDTAGVTIERNIPVFGWDEAPYGHAEVSYDNVRVPLGNILLGEGRGFEIAQSRLGPGRIHHCMRIIGSAEVALAKMCRRLKMRVAFGKPLADQSVWQERIAEARILIDQCRLLTLHAADRIDRGGAKAARKQIAMIKVAAPTMLCRIVDWAIQAHGAAGVTEDFGLSYQYARARVMRIVDGPDEVHRRQIAQLELADHGVGDS
jgi:acyl-CoA dehydrogenase